MRGGTSRGPFFKASDLPADIPARDAVLLAAMGSPDKRQIDGLGGAHPLTSKVGIVSPSGTPDVDVDFLFAQVSAGRAGRRHDAQLRQYAGGRRALRTGNRHAPATRRYQYLPRADREHRYAVRHHCADAGRLRGLRRRRPHRWRYPVPPRRSRSISWIPRGSVCEGLLPTGRALDVVELDGVGRLEITCIDNGMPMVLMRAADLGRTGYETVAALNADQELKQRLEALRLKAAVLMGLGDVSAKPFPKMCLLAPPRDGGSVCTRCFIPHGMP